MLYVYVPCNYTECNQLKILRKNNGTSKRNQGETVLELTLEEAMSSLQTELLMTISLFLNSFFYQTNEHLSVCLSASTCLSVLHRQKQLVLDKRRKSQVKVQVQGKPSLLSPFFSSSSQEKACISILVAAVQWNNRHRTPATTCNDLVRVK